VVPPAPTAEAGYAKGEVAEVRLGERVVFVVRRGRGEQTAAERAAAASQALKDATETTNAADEVRVEAGEGALIIFAGPIPILQLDHDDAVLAGDASVEVHAATVAAKVREALRAEQSRSAIAKTVFSIALVVLLGLLAIYLIRKVRVGTERMRRWLDDNGDRIPAIRLQSMELVHPALLRSGLVVALGLGRWIAQVGIVYAWLVVALSLFDATRGYTERLTGFVVAPLSALAGRVATALPLLVVAAVAGVALFLLVRFVELFFAGVASGETELSWIPADLAQPASVLIRVGIVIGALVFGTPIVTGDREGALAQGAIVALGAMALAATPLLASVVVGSIAVFGRRLPIGHFAEVGGRAGRIRSVGLLEVQLEDSGGDVVKVPHLMALVHPTRLFGRVPLVTVEITVAAAASQKAVRELFVATARELGSEPRVELLSLDADGAHYQVAVRSEELGTRAELGIALQEALAQAAIGLGRRPRQPA
jgi:small-conductance mechanosensitive channel